MGQFLIPVLLLATVGLSTSKILPVSVNQLHTESLGADGQYNDNMFSNKIQTRNVLDEIYNLYIARDQKPALSKLQLMFEIPDNNHDDDILKLFNKNDNYNGEGFRKEQWHNYPRQLDRLHQMYEQNNEKRNYEPDSSKEQYPEEVVRDNYNMNDITNEFELGRSIGTNNVYDTDRTPNPFLILKIRLACLNKFEKADNPYANMMAAELDTNNLREEEKNERFRNENPALNVVKVKREGITSTQENAENSETQNKSVNKRIFSLWSRLQSLNHKGHELQHRRHLHAFYGLPDSDGGGTLTAETRATLMRPPGSPLRWG